MASIAVPVVVDREGVADQAWLELAVGLVAEAALVERDLALPHEVVEAADGGVAGAHPQELDLARGQPGLDQAPVEAVDERQERAGLAALGPRSAMVPRPASRSTFI